MKTNKSVSKTIFGMVMTFLMAMAALMPIAARAEEPMKPMKGAEMLTMKPINTQAQVQELQTGDSIAMVCSMCKSVMIHNVTTEKGHIKIMKVGEQHLCPMCNSTITTVGTGKGPNGAHNEVKHLCAKCGGESVFCCATKPGEGATKGMEDKEAEKK